MTSTGGLGDVEVGGPIVNLIPRTGGNTFENRFQASGLTGAMQGSNLLGGTAGRGTADAGRDTTISGTRACRTAGRSSAIGCGSSTPRGIRAARAPFPGCSTTRTRAIPPSGPTSRTSAARRRRATPARFTPTMRLTWQVSRRSTGWRVLGCGSFKIRRENYPSDRASATNAPETGGINPGNGSSRLQQAQVDVDDDEPAAARGGPRHVSAELEQARAPGNNRDLIRVVEQCTGGCPDNGNIPGLTYRARTGMPTGCRPIVRTRSAHVRHRRTQHEGRLSGRAAHQHVDSRTPTITTCSTGSTTACRTSSRRTCCRTGPKSAPGTMRCSSRISGPAAG